MTNIITKEAYKGKVVIDFYPDSHQYKLVKLDGKELPKKVNVPSVTAHTGLVDKSRPLMGWAVKEYTKKMEELVKQDGKYTGKDVLDLLPVAQNAYQETKQKAADVGTYVHEFCEEYSIILDPNAAYQNVMKRLGVPMLELKTKIDSAVKGVVDWIKKEKIEILSAEEMIYSKKHNYVGLFDAICKYKKGKYLLDWKTSNGIYDEYYLQTSAYLKAYEEECPKDKLDGAIIVAIAKEDKEEKGIKAGDIIVEVRSRGDLLKDFMAFKGLLPVKKRLAELQKEYYQKKNNK